MESKPSLLTRIADFLLLQEDDIHISIFNLFAAGGVAVCFITAFYNLAMGFGLWNCLSILFVGISFSVSMMLYTRRTKRYRGAMLLTVLVIFIGLFTFLFFTSGGYRSGMPCFFVLAVVFTAFLFNGILMPLLVGAELIWYASLCVYAFYHPPASGLAAEGPAYLMDVIVSTTIVGAVLAVTVYFQVQIYHRKQEDLERTRREAEEANHAKTEFLARMSHDVRTPLNTILAMNELIEGNTSSPKIREWIGDSNHSAQILLSLVNDMLDISSIEAGRTVLHPSPYPTVQLITETVKAWKHTVTRSGLHFSLEADPDIPSELMGDRIAIRKIIDNLMSNAVKYTKSGSVTLRVYYERNTDSTDGHAPEEPGMDSDSAFNSRRSNALPDSCPADSLSSARNTSGDGKLVLQVSDTGCGIPPENVDRIFRPFERGAETEGVVSGSGLGLAIVKELTEYMGGTVACRSEPGQGTTFTVTLPQPFVDGSPAGPSESWTAGQAPGGARTTALVAPGVRILVVDDNLYNRKVIGQLLEPLLVQVDDVESGWEALEMIDIRHYDLILMDLRMPEMSGTETFRRMREEYPELDTPVVALTAEILGDIEGDVAAQGFSGYISKPVTSSQLIETISGLLPGRFAPVPGSPEEDMEGDDLAQWKDRLLPYGMDLSLALEHSAGDSGEFIMRVSLFSQYSGDTMRKLEKAAGTPDYYIHAHSMKSAARGIGAWLLADLAEAVELRRSGDYSDKAHGLLLAEYRRVMEGVRLLLDAAAPAASLCPGKEGK